MSTSNVVQGIDALGSSALALTNTIGSQINQLIILISVGLGGALVSGLVAGAVTAKTTAFLNRPRPTTVVIRPMDMNRRSLRLQRRKDHIKDRGEQIMDSYFSEILRRKLDVCFQKLVCAIASRPGGTGANGDRKNSIMQEVRNTSYMNLSSKSQMVSARLNLAIEAGQYFKSEYKCEKIYSKCGMPTKKIEDVISNIVWENFDKAD